MKINSFIDATYLKTAEQANLSTLEHKNIVTKFIEDTIVENCAAVMIRPEFVSLAKQLISSANSLVFVGTVIDFPEGNSGKESKLNEAKIALEDGADELDFVFDYRAFQNGAIDQVKDEVLTCSQLVLSYNKTIKWIMETAALTSQEIVLITTLIKNIIMSNVKETQYANVFVKSSTGFYVTSNGEPNGATVKAIIAMIENGFPLSIKASGGIKSQEQALQYIQLGVKRIGTSSAKEIINGTLSNTDY